MPPRPVPTPARPRRPHNSPPQSRLSTIHGQDQPTETIKVQVNEVNLIFTVTDRKGKFITGLKRERFRPAR